MRTAPPHCFTLLRCISSDTTFCLLSASSPWGVDSTWLGNIICPCCWFPGPARYCCCHKEVQFLFFTKRLVYAEQGQSVPLGRRPRWPGFS